MRILVVSPHPDDETLGAGGTLLKKKKQGHSIYWLNVTGISEELGWDADFIKHRHEQIERIREFYQFTESYNLEFPTTKLTNVDETELITSIKCVFDEVEPEWIIIPGQYDAHSDHRVVYNCCMSASKCFRSPYIKRITSMEILSETEFGYQKERFEPNLFIDITDEIKEKVQAMQLYDTEMEDSPFPRSVDSIHALAAVRGAQCFCKYAEAFCIIKQSE